MDLTGKIKDIQIDYWSKKTTLTLSIDQDPTGLDTLKDLQLCVKLSKYSKKRSLDSNAYFHVLCDKLRQAAGVSMAAMKNDLITQYGQILYIDEGHALIYKTNAPPEYMREREEVHMELIKIGEDGAYWYRAYRGSHTYNTEEMAKLIEGTVLECKNYGIETATPEELKQMQERWGVKFAKGGEA